MPAPALYGWSAERHGTRRSEREARQTVEDPAGRAYLLVAAPPGSALDAGTGEARGGPLWALIGGIAVLARALRSGWRIAITPCDPRGRPIGATRRERVVDEQAAELRVSAIAGDRRLGPAPAVPGEVASWLPDEPLRRSGPMSTSRPRRACAARSSPGRAAPARELPSMSRTSARGLREPLRRSASHCASRASSSSVVCWKPSACRIWARWYSIVRPDQA